MFIWDFVASTVLDNIMDWFYGQVVGFLGNFFAEMGNMGVELFQQNWVQSIVLFFSYLAWALYVTGLVVAGFECGIEYNSGRGNFKEMALNAIKGFLAVSLFTVVPAPVQPDRRYHGLWHLHWRCGRGNHQHPQRHRKPDRDDLKLHVWICIHYQPYHDFVLYHHDGLCSD